MRPIVAETENPKAPTKQPGINAAGSSMSSRMFGFLVSWNKSGVHLALLTCCLLYVATCDVTGVDAQNASFSVLP